MLLTVGLTAIAVAVSKADEAYGREYATNIDMGCTLILLALYVLYNLLKYCQVMKLRKRTISKMNSNCYTLTDLSRRARERGLCENANGLNHRQTVH